MTSRGKTTPSSTPGSYAPSTGARSRVEPDLGLSEATTVEALIADYETRSRENRPDWAEFVAEAKAEPTSIAYEVEEFSADFTALIGRPGDGEGDAFDRLHVAVRSWLDGLVVPTGGRFDGLNGSIAAGRATVRSTIVPTGSLAWPEWFEAEPGSCTLNASELDGHTVSDDGGVDHALSYEEGFAHDGDGDWTAHAWLVDQHGHVVDPTWADTGPGFVYAVADDPFERGSDAW